MKLNENRFNLLLVEKGISKKELAEKAGLSYPTVLSATNNRANITPKTAKKLLDYFGVEFNELFYFKEVK
ncbi:helix-turn-helix transcriptional regulator [Macrococcus equipercicus]|uniref:Helix-turn-helix transcriptional regulator n=1 Tax=Macrococcus equipercicus TaxID=69967 RepID=A0A9Q9BKT8_9STAP|nr:helix-turn-helix transcriptional regulator [Macrococcus equipercicus]UTH13025.1 helix-turn-helix transcriptional regulator [Macrococcus equipercicus]